MTALTFPRDFPCDMRVVASSFVLAPMVEVTPLRSGLALAAELGPSLWQMQVNSGPLNMADIGVVRGFMDTLSSLNTFNAYDPWRQYPYAYRRSHWDGLGGFAGLCTLTTVQSNNVEITLAGLPVGFILTVGDYLAFDYGTSRALHRVSVGDTADGAGVADIEVRPEIRAGWGGTNSPPSASVNLYRASAKMMVIPDSYNENIEIPAYGRVSFRAIQTL